jgi:acetyl-CoA synthetase
MSDTKDPEISALLHEDRVFEPPVGFRAGAIVRDEAIYDEAERDFEGFWARFAWRARVESQVDAGCRLEQSAARQVVRGRTDQRVGQLRRSPRPHGAPQQGGDIWEGEPGDRRTLTYFDLFRQVSAFANVLKSLGVKKGDRVAIYMPLVPELAIAMLACARIGAPHSIVFGGFSAESLRDRINDAQCKLLITADGGYRRGSVVQLQRVSEEAIEATPSIEHVVMLRRTGAASCRRAGSSGTGGTS